MIDSIGKLAPGPTRSFRGVISSLLLLIAVAALAMAGYQTASGRWHATPVLSGSMRPGLQPGDVVLTKRVPISDLQVRDVVVFHPPGQADRQTVHRIVKLTNRGGTTTITTRGDANSTNDLEQSSLSGTYAYRVQRVLPVVGYPAVWLSNGNHGALSMGLGVVLLIAAAATAIRPGKKDAPAVASGNDDRDDRATNVVALDQHPKVPTS
jgi:signal peptidase I